jgi:hypothetical protein
MNVYVTVELFQGLVDKVQVFPTWEAAESAEQAWLHQQEIYDEMKRQCKENDGIEFHIRECEIQP